MKLKKVIFLFLISAVVFILPACGSKDNVNDSAKINSTKDEVKEPFYAKIIDRRAEIIEQSQKNKENINNDNSDYPDDWPAPAELPNIIDELKDEFEDPDKYGGRRPDIKYITISGSNYEFEPNIVRVNQGDAVSITFKNIGGSHDFVIDDLKVKSNIINQGESVEINFIASKKGSFEFYCGVRDHRELGMVGTLIIE